MYMLMLSFSLTLLITTTLMMLATSLSKKSFKDREKSSPFECGFDPKSSARIPFSLQFFLIAVIFLIFDVEIVLMLPMITSIKTVSITPWTIISTMFIIILLAGLYHEWNQESLQWAS